MAFPGDPISIPINFSNQNTRLVGTLYKPEGDEPHGDEPHGDEPHPLMVVLHAASGGLRTYPFYNHLKIHLSQEVIARAIQVRDRVNEYFRGRLPYRVARQEVESVQGEAWFSDAFLSEQDDLPEDVTQDKWYYEMDYDPLAIWSRVRLPTLFIFAEQDRWVPVETSIMNFKAATTQLEDVTIKRIKGTDHLMGLENTEAGATVSTDYLAILTEWLTNKLK